MSGYLCDRCNRYRNDDADGYHYVHEEDRAEPRDVCEDCFEQMVIEHLNGVLALLAVDGLSPEEVI